MMEMLKDKVIFLTGSSAGIGWACAQAYAAEGAHVVLVARHRKQVEEAAATLGPAHLGIECDVSKEMDVESAIAIAQERFGKLDAIHNNAGIAMPSKPLHETTDSEWDDLFQINLKSLLYTTRHGFKALLATKGSILNTSSLVGVIGQEIHAAYSATKGGMNSLTKSMALDYAKHGIRVNAVCPAGVWTPMLREWCKDQPDPSSIERYLDEIHPLGYCPEGDTVADACVFLISDKARFITGQLLHISGGAELGYRRAAGQS